MEQVNNLKVLSWNVRGIMSSALCLSNILDYSRPDVSIICEHKLSNYNVSFLNTIHMDYTSYPCSGINGINNTVSFLVKKDLIHSVNFIEEYSNDRVILLELTQTVSQSVYICGVYLPYDNDVDYFKSYLDHIYDIMSLYSDKGVVVLAGDFNARAFETPYSFAQKFKSQTLTDFINHNNLILINRSSKNRSAPYTFLPTKTTLDYIMIDRQNFDLVLDYETLQNSDVELASDHLALLCTISVPGAFRFQGQVKSLPAWHKTTHDMLIQYQLEVNTQLTEFMDVIPSSETEIENYLRVITNILIGAAKMCIPVSKFVPFVKPYWTPEVKRAHENARVKRKIWVENDKPRGMMHNSYKEYKTAKKNFRNVQSKAIYEYENETFNQLNKCAENDVRLFWRLLKNNKRKASNVCTKLTYDSESARAPQAIADLFSTYFQSLYESNESNCDHLISYADSNQSKFSIDLDDIIQQVKTLKKRKAPGIDMVHSEHIIYGGRTLFICLLNLFRAVLHLNYIPSIWKTGILIPIYKGCPKQKDDPDSYRAVSLLPILYKLFEKIINEKIKCSLAENNTDFPCKQQQGFQKCLSSITTSFNMHETIYSAIELNKVVYVAFLDIRKAFDTVNHRMLFHKLDVLRIPKQISNIIRQAYIGMKSIVMINGVQS